MANEKISELPAATTPLTGSELVPLVQDGITKQTVSSALAGSSPALPLSVPNGGTGLTAGTSGGLPYFSASTTIASSGALTVNHLVLGGGAGAAPTVLGSAGTSTTVLHGNAGGAPTFGAVDLTADVTGDLPYANLAQGSALSVLGVAGNATADVASIGAATDNEVLRRSGTALAFGAVNLASSNAVTGALPIVNGGTGQTVANSALNALLPNQAGHASEFLTSDGTDTSWTSIAAATTGSFLATLTGTTTPTSGTMKYYVINNVVTLYCDNSNLFRGGNDSDGSALTITGLPPAITPSALMQVPCHIYANSLNQGIALVDTDQTISFSILTFHTGDVPSELWYSGLAMSAGWDCGLIQGWTITYPLG